MTKSRPSWDAYFMHLAHTVQTRSNCIRGAVGAVIVRDKQIITTGYNGTPSGVADCDNGGCQRCLDREQNKIKVNERKDLCICIHAEQNAIYQAALHGTSTKGTMLYSTVAPCLICARAIINSGIIEVVYDSAHQDDLGENLLKSAGVTVRVFKHKK